MAESQIVATKWLSKHRAEMVSCPYQPGNLMISKNACSKRYRLGRKEKFEDLLKGDLFNYTYKRGLSLCRSCPIGKNATVAQRMNQPSMAS